jgi:hypothetical protein
VSTENRTPPPYLHPAANPLQEVSSQPNGRRTETRRIHNRRIARLLRGRAARSRSRATGGGARARRAARRVGAAGSRRQSGGKVGNGDAGALAELGNSRGDFYSTVSHLIYRVRNRKEGIVLAMSSAAQRSGTQDEMEAVMLSRPVVHWHFVSVRVQPESGMAAAKQPICGGC